MPSAHGRVRVVTHVGDFTNASWPFAGLDGILMANSLHYIKNKPSLINRLVPAMRPNGTIVIVEYDTESANLWVPYPITYEKLKSLFLNNSMNKITRIGERRSRFGSMMYCCEIKQ